MIYSGQLTMRYVELSYMSQFDTMNAAIRLTYLAEKPTLIEHCSIHHSEGMALYLLVSSQIVFSHNIVYMSRRNAIVIRSTTEAEVCDNLLISNEEREWSEDVSFNDYQASFDVCVGELLSTCTNLRVQRNIVAGGKGVGFTAPAGDCTSDETKAATVDTFKDNVAHGVEAGFIMMMNNALDSPYCGYVHKLVAHHCREVGLLSRFNFNKLVVEEVVLLDNKYGTELGFTNGDNPVGEILLQNSVFVGEHTATLDCTHPNEGLGMRKVGMMTAAAFITTSKLPYMIPGTFHAEGSAAPRGKSMRVENVLFKDFNERGCGIGDLPMVINVHDDSPDLIMHHVFSGLTLDNVEVKNFLYMPDPDPTWA